jgi:acetyl-CoA carboxylase biotin carboxyl carrier protein
MTEQKKFEIDGDAIKHLAALMEETGLTEIEVTEGERHIRVAKTVAAQHFASAPGHHPVHAPAPDVKASETAFNQADAVTSPMVGTAYMRPEPTAAPFVNVGDDVKVGDTLMIIEAMKVMNPIKAVKPGKVKRIVVSDAQPVEFGEVLMIIE